MSADDTRRATRDFLGIAAAAGTVALCCAPPALRAAGALGVLRS